MRRGPLAREPAAEWGKRDDQIGEAEADAFYELLRPTRPHWGGVAGVYYFGGCSRDDFPALFDGNEQGPRRGQRRVVRESRPNGAADRRVGSGGRGGGLTRNPRCRTHHPAGVRVQLTLFTLGY